MHNDPNKNEIQQWYVWQCNKEQRTMVTMNNDNSQYIKNKKNNNEQWFILITTNNDNTPQKWITMHNEQQ